MDLGRLAGKLISEGLGNELGLRKRRSFASGGGGLNARLTGQGVTLLAGLAFAAYEHFVEQKNDAPARAPHPPPAPFPPAPPAPPSAPLSAPPPPPLPARAAPELLLRAMIAAAQADGVIDAAERSALLSRMGNAGLSGAEEAWLAAELAAPWPVDRLAGAAQGPLAAGDLYLAAKSAIVADSPAEHAFLDQLAGALGLDPAYRAALDQHSTPAGA